MLRRKISGVLGVWIILLAFLGIPFSAIRILLILTGLALTIISFAADVTGSIMQRNGEAKK